MLAELLSFCNERLVMVPLLGGLAHEEADLGLREAEKVTLVFLAGESFVPPFPIFALELFNQLELLDEVEMFEALWINLVLFEQCGILCGED